MGNLLVLKKEFSYKEYLLECYEKAKQFIFHPNSEYYFGNFYKTCHQYGIIGLLPLHFTLTLVQLSHLLKYKILVGIRLYIFFRSIGLKVQFLQNELEAYIEEAIRDTYKVPPRVTCNLIFFLFMESLIEGSEEKAHYYRDLLKRFLVVTQDSLFLKRIEIIEQIESENREESIQNVIKNMSFRDSVLLWYIAEKSNFWIEEWFLNFLDKNQNTLSSYIKLKIRILKSENRIFFDELYSFLDQVLSFHRTFLMKLISSDLIQDLHRHYQEVTNLMLEVRRLRQYQQRQITDALHLLQSLQPPHHFKTDHLQLFYRIIPASEVGGDFFDYYYDSTNKQFHFILMDVCGHGLQAAIFVTTLKSHFHYYIKKHKSPQELIKVLSSSIQLLGNQTTFVCFHYGLYHEKTNILELWGGGLPEIIYLSPKRRKIQTLVLTGLPLGLPFQMENDHITLSPSHEDMIILLSDGVIEQEDIKGERISFSSIISIIEKKKVITPYEAINVIPQQIMMKSQTSSFRDDLSIVAIQFL